MLLRNNKVLVEIRPEEDKSESGIIISTKEKKNNVAKVKDFPSTVIFNGQEVETLLKIDDYILLSPNSRAVHVKDELYIVDFNDILMVTSR